MVPTFSAMMMGSGPCGRHLWKRKLSTVTSHESHDVSGDLQPYHYFNNLFRLTTKKIPTLHITAYITELQWVNPPNKYRHGVGAKSLMISRYIAINISATPIDGLVQDRSNPIANALELLQPCPRPLISDYDVIWGYVLVTQIIHRYIRSPEYKAFF